MREPEGTSDGGGDMYDAQAQQEGRKAKQKTT